MGFGSSCRPSPWQGMTPRLVTDQQERARKAARPDHDEDFTFDDSLSKEQFLSPLFLACLRGKVSALTQHRCLSLPRQLRGVNKGSDMSNTSCNRRGQSSCSLEPAPRALTCCYHRTLRRAGSGKRGQRLTLTLSLTSLTSKLFVNHSA